MKLNFCVLAVFFVVNTGSGQFTCLKGDCQSGYGEAVFPSGAKYAGEFQNGRVHGLGTMYFPEGHRYSGYWKNQYREGQGRFTFASGDEYLGAFLHNKMEGKGVMTYANGDVYKGLWKANLPHGPGELNLFSGATYTGYFAFGNFEGEGVMRYADGSSYTGMWKKGMRSGYGTLVASDGTVREGFWENNVPLEAMAARQGEVQMTDTAMSRNCNITYCASGSGRYVYRNGNVYFGSFRNGIPEGEGRVVYPSGDRYEGGWLNHQPQGKGTMFFATGKILRAFWAAGRPIQFPGETPVEVGSGTASGFAAPTTRVFAVVVGAAQYVHMPALRYTDDDAYRISMMLRSPEGGAVPASQLHLLIDEGASLKAILGALRQAASAATENDVLIFYFSGHGIEGAFLPIDFDGHNNQLHHETVREIMYSSKAKHKMVIADACHSGNAYALRSGSVQTILEKYYSALAKSTGGFALLLSSKGTEFSLEDAGLRSGVYSHFLIKGAAGEADKNGDRIVTVKEMHEFLFQRVRAYTAGAQTPLLLGSFDDNMPFGAVR